jgi:UDP-N-acetyl-D-glucosamine/UDP-N-acetyl-D-galactosamine dehydrogenase
VRGARVGILGLAFKENVPDLRNSRVPDIVAELRGFGIEALVHDPLIDSAEARREYGIELALEAALTRLDALLIAVSHRVFINHPLARYLEALVPGGVVMDVKSALSPSAVPEGITYWSL